MARKGRRAFGSVRQLASGRWQARYLDAAGVRHTAPRTFPAKVEATRYLAQVEADLLRGSWADPNSAESRSRSGWSSGDRPRPTCDRGRWCCTTTCFAGSCCRRSGRSRWAELVGLRRRHIDLAGARVQVVEQAAEVAARSS
jgi:hypothetical protein